MRIISMLDVKFENEQAKNLAITEYKSFIRDYNLTPSEIYEAYRMALKELLFDEKENRIDIYPNLSLITAGKVLNAYQRFKYDSREYELGKSKIKNFLNPPKIETEEEKKEQRRKLIENIQDCIAEYGVCEYAFLVYENFYKKTDFQELRKTFPDVYHRNFLKFIAKEKLRNFFYKEKEIQELQKKHPEIIEKLKNRTCKKDEMVPAVFQLTKNELIEKYFKK